MSSHLVLSAEIAIVIFFPNRKSLQISMEKSYLLNSNISTYQFTLAK